jgi:SAM-dependent methyltransferase
MNPIEKIITVTDTPLAQESQNSILEKLNGYAQMYEKLSRNTSLEDLLHLDISYYRETYEDLNPYDYPATIKHYTLYGSEEGRTGSPYSTRESFGQYIMDNCKNQSILEIGPFTRPLVKGPNVKYADIYDTETNKKRAENFDYDPKLICDIDYVSEIKDIPDKFDVVVTSHLIEHIPNLVKHLNEIYNLLNSNGRYCIVIPDHRFCFDGNLPTSTIGDVLEAFYADRKEISLKNIIHHYSMKTHNDTLEHWNFHNSYVRRLYIPTDAVKVMNALIKYSNADKEFLADAHAWYFTPFAFSDIVNCLIKLDLIKFKRVMCNGTVENNQEFTCILEK